MQSRTITIPAIALSMLALLCSGCVNLGDTIRVNGEVVNTSGERVVDAEVIGVASIHGGLILGPGELEDPNPRNESREVEITSHGDGTFTAKTRWAGSMLLSVKGYKLRRTDDLGTVFVVPNIVFDESADDVRLEVVVDE